MRRIWVVIMVLGLIVNMTACGTSPEVNKTENQASNPSGQMEDLAAEGQKIVIWAWDQNFGALDLAIDLYKQKNPQVKFEAVVENVPDTVEKLSTFMASGVGAELPDMVLMDNNEIQSLLIQFPDQVVNLSQKGFDQYRTSFSPAHWEGLSHQGQIYAFPFDIAPLMMQVNTEILAEAGVDPASLKTWQDVIGASSKVIAAGYGMNYQYSNREVLAMMQSAGVGIFDQEGKIDLLNPRVIQCVDLFKQLSQSKAVDINYGESDAGEGKVALALKPAWLVGEDIEAYPDLAGKVKLYEIPAVEEADTYTRSANDGGSSWFILTNSQSQDILYGIGEILATNLEVQKVALQDGLMPGFLPAVDLAEVQAENPYFQGQPIWQLLSESAANTQVVYVNEDYTVAKDIFSNMVINEIENDSAKSAEELLMEAAEMISGQTGRQVNQY